MRADHAAGYRTFPARLPAVLCAIAGVFGLLGALGAGVRASAVATPRDDAMQVRVLMGGDSGLGWLLAALALLVGVSAVAWIGRSKMLKLAAAGIAIAFIVLSAVRLVSFDDTAGAWARAALREPDFAGYHAGLGWGAWLLVTAALFTAFSVIVAALRALDLRKGMAG
ncbi:MAG: hypothetical protein ACRDJ1_09140 [Actinomycetota bacterium]